ncbi:hypothetical protein HPB51_000815 [Rhipicephalus microplus]|uniref:Exonuclease domain-containing protein n=1 Tax=Rhipicephalus microplus TaxID=6941 RepID=A0A9J6EJR7_RHIMP|nr:hypothetical protein HPB51_000815 [Rhipicephalus microplus]
MAGAWNNVKQSAVVHSFLRASVSGDDFGCAITADNKCYTSEGVELTRVTVVGWDLRPVYEKLVKPRGQILDYNTRFSGLTEEDMVGVNTNLRDVQAALLARFSADTILLGHSLDSDLRALRLIHETVVDTAAVFPHRRGLPYKRALRTLMAEHLSKIIQNGGD